MLTEFAIRKGLRSHETKSANQHQCQNDWIEQPDKFDHFIKRDRNIHERIEASKEFSIPDQIGNKVTCQNQNEKSLWQMKCLTNGCL